MSTNEDIPRLRITINGVEILPDNRVDGYAFRPRTEVTTAEQQAGIVGVPALAREPKAPKGETPAECSECEHGWFSPTPNPDDGWPCPCEKGAPYRAGTLSRTKSLPSIVEDKGGGGSAPAVPVGGEPGPDGANGGPARASLDGYVVFTTGPGCRDGCYWRPGAHGYSGLLGAGVFDKETAEGYAGMRSKGDTTVDRVIALADRLRECHQPSDKGPTVYDVLTRHEPFTHCAGCGEAFEDGAPVQVDRPDLHPWCEDRASLEEAIGEHSKWDIRRSRGEWAAYREYDGAHGRGATVLEAVQAANAMAQAAQPVESTAAGS